LALGRHASARLDRTRLKAPSLGLFKVAFHICRQYGEIQEPWACLLQHLPPSETWNRLWKCNQLEIGAILKNDQCVDRPGPRMVGAQQNSETELLISGARLIEIAYRDDGMIERK